MYKPVVWLFSCDLRDISIRYLPAAHPIKRWISFHNHVTYTHSSGIRRRIYEKSALSIPYSPLMDYYFYTFANEERAYSRVRRMVFLHCLHWWIATSTLLQMEKWTCNCIRLIVFSSSPLTDCYLYTSANGEFNISVSERVRVPFVSDYPYFDIRLYCYSVIALSG